MDQELCRFIASGRLHAKIDKVAELKTFTKVINHHLNLQSGGRDRDNQPTGQQERSVSAVHQAGRHPSQ